MKSKNARYFSDINKIICVSDEIKQDLENIGIAGNKLEIISSGVYLDDFKKINREKIISLRNQYSKPVIISVGVLRATKGFEYLIKAFGELKKSINSATLLIIGDGPERNNLEKQATGISEIYFLGRQKHNKVVEYLCASDVFVLAAINASNDREGTSTSIMEAMAAGLPVVATKVGGNPNLIQDGVNGFMVSPGNSSELTKAMLKLAGNDELSQKITKQNLEDIKSKDWPVIAKNIDKIYESVL